MQPTYKSRLAVTQKKLEGLEAEYAKHCRIQRHVYNLYPLPSEAKDEKRRIAIIKVGLEKKIESCVRRESSLRDAIERGL